MKIELSVLACGAVTPVGMSALASYMAMRAGIAAFSESRFFQNTLPPEAHQVSLIPLRPHPYDEPRRRRLVQLAADAIDQCLTETESVPVADTALILCLGEPFRDTARTHEPVDGIVDDIQAELGLRFHPQSRVIREGNAAAVGALLIARDLISSGKVNQCIVGGVDSLLNVADLRTFERSFRLKQKGVAQGFIPGEGAAFIRVADRQRIQGVSALANIVGIGFAREDPNITVLSDGHPTGHGLRKAMQMALDSSHVTEADVVFRVSDLNGEQYRGMESMLAMSRVYRTHRESIPIWLPAASVGETGAAVGAILVMLAALGMSLGQTPGPVALCESSSDSGLRAGCVVCAA